MSLRLRNDSGRLGEPRSEDTLERKRSPGFKTIDQWPIPQNVQYEMDAQDKTFAEVLLTVGEQALARGVLRDVNVESPEYASNVDEKRVICNVPAYTDTTTKALRRQIQEMMKKYMHANVRRLSDLIAISEG